MTSLTDKPQTEFLSLRGEPAPVVSFDPPGFEGPRACLLFVLTALAGSDSGVIRQEVRKAKYMGQSNPAALEAVSADQELLSVAEQSMISVMRELADHWIDSGKNRSDRSVDTPSERNVVDIPKGYTWSLAQRIRDEFLNAHPSWQEMRRDGTLGFADFPPRFHSEYLEEGERATLSNFGRETAYYWFLKLLNSPYSRHIARCDHCKSYFAYERAPRRSIKNGVFCPKCKGTASLRRTQSTRNRRKGEMVGYAADVWEQWKPDSRHGQRPKWVAQMLKTRTGRIAVKAGKGSESAFPIITGSWVTRNQSKIEAEVERRKHATRKN